MENVMKCSVQIFILIILITAIFSGPVAGDKGSVSITKVDIPIDEPGQKAIICWDESTELLILSTDIKASQSIKALEILPLPAEPEIYPCNYTIFESITHLVEWQESRDESKSLGTGGTSISKEKIEIEVLFYKSLGIHNLTVIKAYTASGFANWTSEFIRSVGLTPMSYPEAEQLAESYISRDINYFVLDIIDLTPELTSPQPLIYIFESTSVYYPMEITSLTGGYTHILLYILTPYEITRGPYDTVEDSFLTETVTTWKDEKFIDLRPPGSPVTFKKITSTDIHISDIHDDGVRTHNGFYEDPDVHHIKDFFQDYLRIKISAYEYDGPVEMEGDISINTYSIESVKDDEEKNIKAVNFIIILLIPPIIIVVFIVALLLYILKKTN